MLALVQSVTECSGRRNVRRLQFLSSDWFVVAFPRLSLVENVVGGGGRMSSRVASTVKTPGMKIILKCDPTMYTTCNQFVETFIQHICNKI